MKKTTLVSRTIFTAMALVIMAFVNVQTASAQNISFNGYWEAPNGWILLFKERIYLFVNPDGSLTGGTGGFAHTNGQFTLQHPHFGTIPFNYTVIDSGNIRVTDNGGDNAWANGTWRKRNIRGTAINHPIIGYWEGKIGDTTRILYFAGRDIVPAYDLKWYAEDLAGRLVAQDGWWYDFDRENNLVSIGNLYFYGDTTGDIFDGNPPGYDGIPRAFRFDGTALLVERLRRETPPNTEIMFIRR